VTNNKPCKVLLFALASLFFASSCATSPVLSKNTEKPEGTFKLRGKTRYQEKGLSSGEIILMRAEPGGAIYKTTIRPDGSFQLDLPPGPYFLMGSGLDNLSAKSLFAFWTNNPLRIHTDVKEPVVLPFVESTPLPVMDPGGGIGGKVLHEGKPVSGAVVAAFLDASGEFHGLPYVETEPTGNDGRYILKVGPGRYFILARSRSTGSSFQGPLLKGDLAGFYPHNPVILRQGEGLVVDVPLTEVNRPRGEGSLAHGESIVVEGIVRDVTGKGVAGVRVVLYTIPEMLGRPMFISSPTDEQGAYRLEVSRHGRFYAAARSVIGRPAETGELMGFYDGTEDHSLVLEMGDRVEGVDIVVREVW
jgi:hypothetical protein